jgi:DNA-binding CsgD family transcriptional regulator
MTPVSRRAAVDGLVRACDEHGDSRSLRLALIDELRGAIGFDAYAWLLTDPETEVGAGPLADVPCLPELPRLIRLRYATPVNRWTTLEQPVGRLRAATDDHRERSLVWREVLVDYDVGDVGDDRLPRPVRLLGVPRALAHGNRGLLHRGGGRASHARRRANHGRAAEGTGQRLRPSSAPDARVGPVVLLLTADLAVRAQTPETEAYLRALVPPDGDRQPVPSGAFNVGAQLLAVEAGVDQHPPLARVHLAGGMWLTLRAGRIDASSGADSDITVTIETTTPTERIGLFSRASGLTSREAELLILVSAGADTREIADRMYLSQHTVQDHLKSIFAKTATRNRRALVARATGSA